MSDVMQRCVPLSTGAVGPDLRVNYQYGLVLGVDEFEQEDRYFRERDERAARTLHGCGTATGLHVTAARPVVAPDDVEVRVEPGIAIDQHGRPVVVRTSQCARIGAWLASEVEQAAAAGLPSPIDAHRSPSGDLTLYVVAGYSSCFDALVPLPGNPCGSDDEVTAPSRIRDSWDLELRWGPPTMAGWDGCRALADLLLTVDIDDDSPVVSDEDLLAAHVRALAPGAPAPPLPLPPVPVLPRAEARAALDRLVTIWLTEVRPALALDLIDPDGDPAVLLSAITVVPADPFDPATPVVDSFLPPDDDGRPYLAPTQLVQELTLLGGGSTVVLGSPVEPPAAIPTIELASLVVTGTGSGRRLLLWSHLDDPLVLPASVAATRNGGAPVPFATSPGPLPATTVLAPPGGALVDEELLAVVLDLERLSVRDVPRGVDVPLSEHLRRTGLDVAGRVGSRLVLRTQVEREPVAPAPPVRPTRELVTASFVALEGAVGIEVWFHVDKVSEVDDERVEELDRGAVRLLAEVEPGSTPVELDVEVRRQRHNVFVLRLEHDRWKAEANSSPYLRLLLDLRRIGVRLAGTDLASYLRDLDLQAEGVEEDGRVLALYLRVSAVAR